MLTLVVGLEGSLLIIITTTYKVKLYIFTTHAINYLQFFVTINTSGTEYLVLNTTQSIVYCYCIWHQARRNLVDLYHIR